MQYLLEEVAAFSAAVLSRCKRYVMRYSGNKLALTLALALEILAQFENASATQTHN